MRAPQNVAAICRCMHTSSRASSPRILQRNFHQTPAYLLPRRRNFFTSNPLMSQNGDDASSQQQQRPASDLDRVTDRPATASSPAAKRKSTRAAGAKNSLRRVAIIAQQPGGRAPGGVGSTSAAPAEASAEAGVDDGSNIISAVCVAESFDMDLVTEILQAHGFRIDPDGTGFDAHEVVHARGVSNGDIFVFPSGTVVSWSLPPDVVDNLATKQLLRAAGEPHVGRREVEDLEFVADPSRDGSSMKGDVVVLGTRREVTHGDRLDTTLAKIAFSSGLARSTKLAVLESSLTDYFESTRRIPALLSRGSRLPLSRRFILQKTGELLGLRAQLNHYSELTDSLPDIFWDQSSELGLEGYYEQVGRALDVNVRIRALNQKMDYAQEIASVLREMSTEKHSARLEWIIIVLITVEVVFELRRVYLDYLEEKRAERLVEEVVGSG
ncbi:required for meiotic nuclear division protein 1 like protein [Pleurostoma richardsiae]|uniref:Required for meiotic nuclear division protein 1 like protein n=1 Tax=Pleurostoma richardsiae TaxID=41990 RepID=A0AA38RV71_9PEZI|nr:required for meiotic nuclear division protein 1 like protein [Pleurostoma richardsiae]